MERNLNKTSGKRLISFGLIVSIVAANILPIFSRRAEAFIVTDPGHTAVSSAHLALASAETAKKTIKDVADSIAMVAARIAIQQVVNSTVRWAQSGFQGNPAYVTNPEQYFTDLADGIAGDFIAGSDLAYLCSPFQTQIRLALQKAYVEDRQFQCTLTDVVANIEAFYGDFNQGGWDAWFSMTQNSSNNPYGAYLDAQVELDSRIASSIGLKREQLAWSSGFLSFERCTGNEVPNGSGGTACLDANGNTAPKETVTPGVVIKEQLNKVLPSGMESLITVNHVEQLIQAFATALLSKYVFGSDGLFNRGSSSLPTDQPGSSTGTSGFNSGTVGIDIDGDGTNDIIITDESEICVYGGTYPNCQGSQEAEANNGVVWGYVFEDTNGNGVRNPNEPLPSNVPVYLKSADGSSNLGNSSTFQGVYSFGNLANGQTYIVGIVPPTGFVIATSNDVSVTAAALVPNQSVQDFGIAPQ